MKAANWSTEELRAAVGAMLAGNEPPVDSRISDEVKAALNKCVNDLTANGPRSWNLHETIHQITKNARKLKDQDPTFCPIHLLNEATRGGLNTVPIDELKNAIRRMGELAEAEKNGTPPPDFDASEELSSRVVEAPPKESMPNIGLKRPSAYPPLGESTAFMELEDELDKNEKRKTPAELAKEQLQGFAARPHLIKTLGPLANDFIKKHLPDYAHFLPRSTTSTRNFPYWNATS